MTTHSFSQLDNPFTLLGITATFYIDEARLSAHYLRLQQQFHPDNFAHKTAKERQLATQFSANLIDAYKTLSDPVKRAIALLEIHGHSIDLEHNTNRDKTLLMTQLTLREKIDQAETKDLPNLQAEFKGTFDTLCQTFNEALLVHALDRAAQTVISMRYYQKLLAEIAEKSNQPNKFAAESTAKSATKSAAESAANPPRNESAL
ncbi:Fe-S protein assembly co-chaperone HscB [Ostreibacterium oceani]|uniref:Co-chaperone protein HscB homolog n=1 Tax=Ostreibacterium oceani TaxID=2654998 RepID=A0A6N7EQP4_9GAMM|nr:Fe-S protein assembly co-chaperone HscB [Ostreibacterium oceani]MPV85174.1 Fe-S protein assembly co-chaperone HscB [Ostreibacterium oceani]